VFANKARPTGLGQDAAVADGRGATAASAGFPLWTRVTAVTAGAGGGARGDYFAPRPPSITPLGAVAPQAKLIVGPPDDQYEREADAVADQVMRMPDPAAAPLETLSAPGRVAQRMCAGCEEEEEQKH
jgi:hypothetical protein